MVTSAQLQKLQHKILSWYKQNKRDLPWRRTTDPYTILVSEVMLQQTQVDRVIPYYQRFMMTFPHFTALAAADKTTLLKLWSGLGYNNRVLRLQKLAQVLVKDFEGKLPRTEEALIQLPGIGPYTARALLAFAFNQEVAVVDTNIRRVLIHELRLKEDISIKDLEKIAFSAIPLRKSRIWHNALMDYGSLEKTARKTGIKPLSKQGPFIGSDRWLRGQIVKEILAKKKVTFLQIKKRFDHPRTSEVIAKMEKEGIIFNENKVLRLQ